MLAVYAARQSADDPLSGLEVGERPEPEPREGWTTVTLKTAGLNHHDVWSLRGVGLAADRLPMILGCDGAGVDEDGNEVIVHAVVAQRRAGAATRRSTRAARCCPSCTTARWPSRSRCRPRNLVPKPAGLSWEHAACLSTAWLTAYRMLFTNAGLTPGATVLVQGAGGGVATALRAARRGGRLPDVGDHAATRPRVRGRSRSAPTARSSPASGCPSGSTR